MPPTRLLAKDFLASIISSEQALDRNKNTTNAATNHAAEIMLISDNESEITENDKAISRRKTMQLEQELMQAEGVRKKEALSTMENKLRNLKLNSINNFEL